MARLVTSGAELQGFDGATGVEGSVQTSGASTITCDTGTKRSGNASFKCVAAASGGAATFWTPSSPVTALGNTLWFRAWYFFTSVTNLPFCFLSEIDDTGASLLLGVQAQAANQLQLWNGHTSALFGNLSAALTANTWHRVDLVLNVPASGNGTASLYLDGVAVTLNASQNFGNTAIGLAEAGLTFANAAQTCWVDDIAVNDSTGSNENSMPGPGNVVLLKPVSDNARVGFTAGAGGTTSLFAGVSNFPPVGVIFASGTNTSQIKDTASNTTDHYDANVGAYTDSLGSGGGGMGGRDVVNLVQPVTSHSASTGNRVDGIQSLSNPVAAEVTQTGTHPAGTWPTGWTTIPGTVVYNPAVALSTKPVLRFRKGTATTDANMSCMMGMLVEYTPAPSISQPPVTSQAVQRAAVR